ncbi:ABC transporter permease [Streptomyces sp. NPDC058252]|uniref:ABC transporter permease n=1 Tax=Streptomyces sp. NPDC058252 TaxID=3346405 RepID=UPI0036ED6DAF
MAGLLPKMLVVTLTTFFPLAANLAAGFAATDRDAMRLLRSLGTGRIRAFRLVRVPSALPHFFTGLRVSIIYAVVGAVFAEYAGAEKGLGIYLQALTASPAPPRTRRWRTRTSWTTRCGSRGRTGRCC